MTAGAYEPVAVMTYATFALEQPISLFELAAAAPDERFPLASAQTPVWFAAAASDDSSLLDIAPELMVVPADTADPAAVDVAGLDLIRVYAPELALPEVNLPVAEPGPPVADARPDSPAPSTATQLGLLSELADLDR